MTKETEAIDEHFTDRQRLKVGVRVNNFAFPNTCLLCGNEPINLTQVAFTKTLILGVVGGIESVVLDIPLCSECAGSYKNAHLRHQIKMAVCFLGGMLVAFLGMNAFPSVSNSQLTYGQIASLVLGGLLILYSFLLVLRKGRFFPIKLNWRQGKLFTGHSHYIFHFPDAEMMDRFLRANETEEAK